MERLKMQTPNMAEENFKKLKELFPEAVTEVEVDGVIKPAIDKDVLQQLISNEVVEGPKERYQFTWPGKHEAMLLAGKPTNKTLRPVKGENPIDDACFNTTENLYIEGDNLEVMKILETKYAGKIKMIYIDPPYNRGSDFIYKDKFESSKQEYIPNNGEIDEEGNQLVKNLESNGRFHSDWLSMMYSRLKIGRNLLKDDGAIFISIDENEQTNLKKLCDEIFGETNRVAEFVVIKAEGGGMAKQVIKGHDYLFVYAKNINVFRPLGKPKDIRGKIIERDGEKYWIQEDWLRKEFGKYGNCHYEEILEYKGQAKLEEINEGLRKGNFILLPKKNGMNIVGKLRSLKEDSSKFYSILKHLSAKGIDDLKKINLDKFFDYPKPVSLMVELITGQTIFTSRDNDIILDFFSGSATTAHAVIQLNAEDGGNRKFIMVQLQESCEKLEAYKAGYRTICDIGKERIRRAGVKVKDGLKLEIANIRNEVKRLNEKINDEKSSLSANNDKIEEFEEKINELSDKEIFKKAILDNIDIGFRVLRLDSSNMKDVFYRPRDLNKDDLLSYTSNIKEDRTHLDLLFQAMPEIAGADYDAKIDEITISNKKVFKVNTNYIVACFEENINEEVIREIAKLKPYHAIFRDSSFPNDSLLANLEQIFRIESPDTEITVL